MKKQEIFKEPEFVVDKKGNKTKIILDISVYKKILGELEELEDKYLGKKAKKALDQKDKFIDFEHIKKKLLK